MIKRPVVFDKRDRSIIDNDRNVIAHPFLRVGRPSKEIDDVGVEIALCINSFIPEDEVKGDLIPVAQESISEITEPINESVVVANGNEKVKKKRGRPFGKLSKAKV